MLTASDYLSQEQDKDLYAKLMHVLSSMHFQLY